MPESGRITPNKHQTKPVATGVSPGIYAGIDHINYKVGITTNFKP
jgi:hypothetical protein